MSDIDRDIAEVEATLRHLKKLRRAQRPHNRLGTHHSQETRAKMSAARKAAWAKKHEAEMQPRRKRESRSRESLRDVPSDALESALFGVRR